MTDGAESRVVWSGRLGHLAVEVRETDGRRVLRIDDWSTVFDDRTGIHHHTGVLRHRLVVRRPGLPPVVFRYRLRWLLQLAPIWEATYDRWSAEADDPGLELVEILGGTDDWS
ncbi:hypothetical protein ACFQ6N_20025 [Kitasatospora sp. NPDC056446]|uniref:hypothetical protein n=1 Tax=Kitasatospora sp. NPDC056446 TaxID=3345819 RepID=UPI0036A86FDF